MVLDTNFLKKPFAFSENSLELTKTHRHFILFFLKKIKPRTDANL